jgi:hypothetical protein
MFLKKDKLTTNVKIYELDSLLKNTQLNEKNRSMDTPTEIRFKHSDTISQQDSEIGGCRD